MLPFFVCDGERISGDSRRCRGTFAGLCLKFPVQNIAKISYTMCRVWHNNAKVEAVFMVMLEKNS